MHRDLKADKTLIGANGISSSPISGCGISVTTAHFEERRRSDDTRDMDIMEDICDAQQSKCVPRKFVRLRQRCDPTPVGGLGATLA
jgi:hypothetical protein